MKQYEVTFIVDPVLSGDEIKATAQTYVDLLTNEGCTIVHNEEMGLRQLAYPINKRSSGVYYCIEFQSEKGDIITKIELALRRDERIIRFLTARLEKYGIKYNDDKRNGLIGKAKKSKKKDSDKANEAAKQKTRPNKAKAPAPKPVVAAPKPAPAPVVVETPAPVVTETVAAVAEEEE